MTEISYQLYSSREFPPLADTLKMLANAGYSQVEGYGGLYNAPKELAALLSLSGLSMPSGHISLDMLENEPDKVIELAKVTGMKAVYCPHIGPELRPDNAEGWREFGERVQAAGKAVRAAGLTYGWHNHDFEFVRQADGSIPMEEMFAGGPQLSWEADIAWIVRGGGDPLDWIARHGSRISAAHIKDIAPDGQCLDEDGWVDVGHGTMDWKSIWTALKSTPCELFIVEHDKPNDDRRFATRSIAAISAFED